MKTGGIRGLSLLLPKKRQGTSSLEKGGTLEEALYFQLF